VLDMQATLLAAMMNLGSASPAPATTPSPNRVTSQVAATGQVRAMAMPLAQSKKRAGQPSIDKSNSQHQHSLGKHSAAGLANQRLAKPAVKRKQRASTQEWQQQAADK
jgi:hypothetical protein